MQSAQTSSLGLAQLNVHKWLVWREVHGTPKLRTHLILSVLVDSGRDVEITRLGRTRR
jgi:hypothetical protein